MLYRGGDTTQGPRDDPVHMLQSTKQRDLIAQCPEKEDWYSQTLKLHSHPGPSCQQEHAQRTRLQETENSRQENGGKDGHSLL